MAKAAPPGLRRRKACAGAVQPDGARFAVRPMMTKRELRNGARLLMEPIDHVRSASVGLWLEVGSRHEPPEWSGACHFIEHMLFKGAAHHTALQLADAMNRLGGHFNAFTSQEALCLHARLIDNQLSEGLELLAEMLLTSTFPEEELQRERNVILEEYKMIEDTPDDLVIDLFHEALWGQDPVGRPVIGRLQTIASLSRPTLRAFLDQELNPSQLIIAVAGALDEKSVEDQVQRLFGDLPAQAPARRPSPRPHGAFQTQVRQKDMEQVQFCFGCLGPARVDEDRYRFSLLSAIVGGGMSSRVFKEVREKRGLAYSIGSYLTAFRDTGGFAISGGTSPERLAQVVELCVEEIRSLYREGVRGDELDLAKEQLKTSLLFALESTGARMTRLAEQEIYHGRFLEVDEILREIDAVSAADIRRVAEARLRNAPVAIAAVAPPQAASIQLETF